MKRRLLPDACYDFYAVDGRDGERWGPYRTINEAQSERKRRRAGMDSWMRPAVYLESEVNERKVLAVIRAARAGTPDEETKR